MTTNPSEKIIIDSDAGIDDALALMLALSCKHAEILAVTCCFGNTTVENVCGNVMRVLTVCDAKHIPVHRGCECPLIKSNNPVTVHGSDGLGKCAHEYSTGGMKISETPAAVALSQLAKKHTKEITLIAIGPLTNIALAHRLDPDLTSNLKSIVCMGGNYKGIGNTTEVAEFNFYCDPESANIVLSEAACPLVLVPWETTVEYGIDWDYYKILVETRTKKGEFMKRITEFDYGLGREESTEMYYDCDFLAASAALYPECTKSNIERSLAVEYEGRYTKGLTILRKDSPDSIMRNKRFIVTDFDALFLNNLRKQMVEED